MTSRDRLPPGWLGLALIAWGAFTDQIFIAVLLALVIEASRISPVKLALNAKHFYHVADFASVLFAVVSVYQFTEHSIHGIYGILAVLPICVFPLVAAERYSFSGLTPLSALFVSLRRRVAAGAEEERSISLEYIFVLVCVLAASRGGAAGYQYVAVSFVLLVGPLMLTGPKRYRWVTRLACVAVVLMIAGVVNWTILGLQYRAESLFTYWLNQVSWLYVNPDRTRTSIGQIGRLKLSDHIRIRVRSDDPIPLPLTLREASYNTFKNGNWLAEESAFEAIDPLPGSGYWALHNSPPALEMRIKITANQRKDTGVAPLPLGANRLFGAEIIEVQRNQYGTVLVEAIPGEVEYEVGFLKDLAETVPPRAADLVVPKNYRDLLSQVLPAIVHDEGDAQSLVEAVGNFFDENFKYSLIQRGYYPGRKPLASFLLEDKRGHCEYFATATVLLLRAGGVPARYVVGYQIDEYSPLEDAFVARARHAHSWAEAYLDGRWIVVDNTPSEWYELEQMNASGWQEFQDLWSWLRFHYDRFRRTDRDVVNEYLLWMLLPLIGLLGWRLRGRARKVDRGDVGSTEAGTQDDETVLSEIFARLRKSGVTPSPGDTVARFLPRYAPAAGGGITLASLVERYYRQRFSPDGLDAIEEGQLDTDVSRYLAHIDSP